MFTFAVFLMQAVRSATLSNIWVSCSVYTSAFTW